ncbi:MAG TPA: winged helix DNA-binding domain-containing protein [Vicinamibacterales bacterium]|nr:winged helix DNA-binding domain-containing protein [Vicinamibacterales bacterium]
MFALTVPFPWVTDTEVSEAGLRRESAGPGVNADFFMAASSTELLTTRLRNQLLVESACRKPAQVVSWLCAMQAQDYPAAKWAIGSRAPGCQDGDVEQDFNDGLILRTHVLRPTWHFVTPDDIRWLLKLSAPRIHAQNAYYYRQSDLDAKTFAKSCAMIHRTLEGGKTMTRAELATYLKRAKIPADGLKLAYLMMHAELEGVICSGPRRGKQFTYALLDERVPRTTKMFEREEALAELAARYFSSHGPATVRDFAWWSGLTAKDAQRAAESADTLETATIGGTTHWNRKGNDATPFKSAGAWLLPNYDEYLIAYKDRAPFVDATRAANVVARSNGAFANHLVTDGCLAGSWSRTLNTHSVLVEVAPYKKLAPAQSRAVANAVESYGEFLGLPATLSLV